MKAVYKESLVPNKALYFFGDRITQDVSVEAKRKIAKARKIFFIFFSVKILVSSIEILVSGIKILVLRYG
ncbi:hypothetical protein GCM10008119_02710 [Pedobacter mendelii]|uniref:Uncharacterized protein n=1 Tax=Pedobacter mendelii TaxID=1908240 RepID=A0ABQ2BEW9_9SPHI|nr:hypothetical protein GCM10008119_02710 [Pedobacter mendelii]